MDISQENNMLQVKENTRSDYVARHSLFQSKNIVAFPHYWQRPAATEEEAFKAIVSHPETFEFQYFGFAWATLIDGLKRRSFKVKEILLSLRKACELDKEKGKRRCTVAQHIHALDYIEVFVAAGITDLFYSHATVDKREIQGIRIHPFPLYPAQAPYYSVDASHPVTKKYLANFIGAYNPSIYLSNVREIIFGDAGKSDDLLIIKRDRWHFDRVVYEEQIAEESASSEQLSIEDSMKKEYLDAIQESWFTLCPTGSGPNSIRTFECLALGSIPIILTTTLRLAGSKELWNNAAIIEEDSKKGYRRALSRAKNMSEMKRCEKLKAGRELFNKVGPNKYAQYIFNMMEEMNENKK